MIKVNSFKKQKNGKNSGITLIALITTIIVLLILAGVSIATLTGQNGILTQAKNSKTQTEIGEEKEAIGLAYNGAKTEKLGGEVTAGDLNDQFTKNGVNVLNCSYLAMERMLKKEKILKKEETSSII